MLTTVPLAMLGSASGRMNFRVGTYVFSTPTSPTAPVAIVNFMQYEGWEWGKIAAGGTVVTFEVAGGKPGAFRDVSILNAAATLIVAGKAKDLKEGAALAAKSIDGGEAEGRLDRLIKVSNTVDA